MERLLLGGIVILLVAVLRKQYHIIFKQNILIMTTQEAVAKIDAQAVKLEKVRVEVQALKDAAANSGDVSPELAAAIDRVDAALTSVDDINPDEVTEEPAA